MWIWLGFSIAGGVLNRLGGIGHPFNTKWRDWGVPLTLTVYALILKLIVPWWAFLLSFGLLWGALSTYFNLDDKKWGFWAHGLAVSLAILPIAYFTGTWVGFILRTVVLTAFITVWSEFTKWDVIEECGRGFAIIGTLPLLCIGI